MDVIGTVDPGTYAVTGESHYAAMVRDARRQRRLIDGKRMDWVVMRNRLTLLGSRNKRLVGEGLSKLATQLGFRCVDGLAERIVYRELFPCGLTALDQLDEATLGTRPSLSHATARAEVLRLIETGAALSDIAVNAGFSDQPHMTRAITALTGRPPGYWAGRVKTVQDAVQPSCL